MPFSKTSVMNIDCLGRGYYGWLSSDLSPRAKRTATIRESVMEVYQQSNGIYGSYKIAQKLKSDSHLETACRNTVAKAMKDLGIKSLEPECWAQVSCLDHSPSWSG